ncbi:hypothetical protein [Microtetraspora sp. NBRC 16547]|uniref:hypothetical protein n=1 Tax=Microtetraspora sp. NBRC 16547 TaxID=3030993 RepID=UPI0024A27CFB|nr:hypothetical protein [Microtetraspora sp. NBRC 16547]GLX02650.1 hypothetical protein Misp02_67360 [Microtetraspora sp. NBRC 16547]
MQTRAPDEIRARHSLLQRLGDELDRRHCTTRLVRYRDHRWALKVGHETVFCAGAEGIYAYVTRQGIILSSADDTGITTAAAQLSGQAR